jgi:glycine oxidase
MIDFIIVGHGIAGIAFAETALNVKKTVLVFDNSSQTSSKIAAGIFNPIILKRFTVVANAQKQLELAHHFYSGLQLKLDAEFVHKVPVFRKFFSTEEQNNWFIAQDKPKLAPFLADSISYNNYKSIDAPFGFGRVLQTGYVDSCNLISQHARYLDTIDACRQETFDYNAIILKDNFVEYKGIKARHIVFAEGFGVHANPYFMYLPVDGTKGEVLTIKAVNLDLNVILNASLYIVPLGNDLFKVGATYEWDDKSQLPTNKGKEELLEKLNDILSCDFEVVKHEAGVRPTTKDRNPIIGSHPKFKNLHILNGLGTRGIMWAPFLAPMLFNHIENKSVVPREISCDRYDKFL